jgi:transcriptional regulator GlxA family with amidase domain
MAEEFIVVKISFIAVEDCVFSGISGLFDSFAIANLRHSANTGKEAEPLFATEILSADGKALAVNGGFQITPHGSYRDLGRTDIIILPPFLPPHIDAQPKKNRSLLAWITARHQQGAVIAAVCTGTFVLAETGLLDGRLATTNWVFARHFRRRFPKVLLHPERILTEDDGLICTGAASAFYNLGLHIIENFASPELASQCAKVLLVDANRLSQASYSIFSTPKGHGDDGILKAQKLMESHLGENLSMENLAGQVGISPRHFIRRFKKATGESPLQYLQQIRIEKAKKIMETGPDTVEEITRAIGYENSSTFRKIFKKFNGLSPREYRDKFARQGERIRR